MNRAITWCNLPKTLIGRPMRGCMMRVALALSHWAVVRLLVSMSILFFLYSVIARMVLFSGGGSLMSLLASQLLMAGFGFSLLEGVGGGGGVGGVFFLVWNFRG